MLNHDNKPRRYGIKWDRDETILAMYLYCQTPFSKIGKNLPSIIELAKVLERTPDSVALKMQNLAHFDPAQIERNVVAMSNTSKLDSIIFAEFSKNMQALAYEANNILRYQYKQPIDISAELDEIDEELKLPDGSYKESLVKVRIGQNLFRKAVLNIYHSHCCITGINTPELLIASHIKPWNVSNPHNERTNPRNGLCLNAFHDRAFDQGLITFDKDYRMIISQKLKNADMQVDTRRWIASFDKQQIYIPDYFQPNKEFLQYHNDVIFKG